jgi:D-alanine-D-alanine ligase
MSDKPGPVLIVHNTPRKSDNGGPADFAESDAGVMVEVQGVIEATKELGIASRVEGVSTLEDLRAVLAAAQEPMVFNLVEALDGPAQDFNFVPALCRAFGKACTGSDSPALMLSLDKWQCRSVLQSRGLPVPDGVLVPPDHRIPDALPAGPFIVKPACADAGEGIDSSSVVQTPGEELQRAVRRIHERFGQPALIEHFLDGRELNVSVLQKGEALVVLPIAEIDFSAFGAGAVRILDYSTKWHEDSFAYRCVIPAPLDDGLAGRVREIALEAWRAIGCRDYARVDFRLDSKGRPYVLEVNTNPDISPGDSFAACAAHHGISYERFIETVLDNAASRLPSSALQAPTASGVEISSSVGMRRTEVLDRAYILRLLAETAFFRDDELAVAREVLDDALAGGPDGDYQSYTAVLGGKAVGWVCFGPTPCTLGTFDLYWIAVSPSAQGKGVGAALMNLAENRIARRGGRLVIVETSGREQYNSTRKFYLKLGYQQAANIPDFYAPNDPKIVYVKTVSR